MVVFGGAGPMHGCDLAESLGVPKLILPPHPGVLSAMGLALAEIAQDVSRSLLTPLDELIGDPRILHREIEKLGEDLLADREEEGGGSRQIQFALDLRYRGQSYELTIPGDLAGDQNLLRQMEKKFHETHERRFGYHRGGEAVEAVTLRLRGTAPGFQAATAHEVIGEDTPVGPPLGDKQVWFDGDRPHQTPCYLREKLRPGHQFDGPAMIFQKDTTIVVKPDWHGVVDGWGNLILERGAIDG
jgi:N-methylhydantoinase A